MNDIPYKLAQIQIIVWPNNEIPHTGFPFENEPKTKLLKGFFIRLNLFLLLIPDFQVFLDFKGFAQ